MGELRRYFSGKESELVYNRWHLSLNPSLWSLNLDLVHVDKRPAPIIPGFTDFKHMTGDYEVDDGGYSNRTGVTFAECILFEALRNAEATVMLPCCDDRKHKIRIGGFDIYLIYGLRKRDWPNPECLPPFDEFTIRRYMSSKYWNSDPPEVRVGAPLKVKAADFEAWQFQMREEYQERIRIAHRAENTKIQAKQNEEQLRRQELKNKMLKL
jgi:hypothetical protein